MLACFWTVSVNPPVNRSHLICPKHTLSRANLTHGFLFTAHHCTAHHPTVYHLFTALSNVFMYIVFPWTSLISPCGVLYTTFFNVVMYCTPLYCIILMYCTPVYCTVVMYCTPLHFTAQHFPVAQCLALHWSFTPFCLLSLDKKSLQMSHHHLRITAETQETGRIQHLWTTAFDVIIIFIFFN